MGYPGLSDQMTTAVVGALNGKIDAASPNFAFRRFRLFHRIAIAASNTATTFQFFNTTPANRFIGNFQPTGLANETAGIMYGLRLKVETGYDIAGTIIAGNAGDQVGAVATPYPLAEALRKLYENGLVNLSVADRKVIDNIHGVYNFPAGGGPDITFGGNGTAPVLGAVTNNGAPFDGNQFDNTPGFLILPNKPIVCNVDYQTAIAPPVAAVFKAELDMLFISPINN